MIQMLDTECMERRLFLRSHREGSIAMSKMDRITAESGELRRDEKMNTYDYEMKNRVLDADEILQLARIGMQDAEMCEMESDYIGAAGLYRMCSEMFAGLMERGSVCREAAKGEYMHTLFRQAMLPQTREQEKLQYLETAYTLAAELEKETGEIEFMIAAESIQDELETLNRTLGQRFLQKQRDEIQFI